MNFFDKKYCVMHGECSVRVTFGVVIGLLSGGVIAESVTAKEVVQDRSETLSVTVTGEYKPLQELTSSVHSISGKDVSRVNPAHPSDILNRQAGVHVNNLGGEGHMTAIRQPISTSAVYLFLEDGLPTRPSGLFNHNALYEVNMPQAKKIEIVKGPGSALYGSESIGGIINTITEESPDQFEFSFNPEVGADQWSRMLLSTGNQLAPGIGARFNLNVTDNEGYRDEADYARIASTLRFDADLGQKTQSKTIIAISQIEQSGIDGLDFDAYQAQSSFNRFHNDVGRRNVDAVRLSNEFVSSLGANKRLTVTPYFRDNQMELMPSWMLGYDPNDRDYQFQSYGFLARLREKTSDQFEWTLGLDTDYTPSQYREIRVTPTVEDGLFIATTPSGRVNYDFTADQLALSPYVHTEWQAFQSVRFTAGVRYDYFSVEYQDQLDSSVVESQSGADRFTHLRPDSQTLTFESVSPKLGVVWNVSAAQSIYGSYRHSFRAPSVGALFRSGSSTNTDQLSPIKTDSFEIGTRGQFLGANFDLAFYHMNIQDDIVSIIDQATSDRKVANAGETFHQGVELTLAKRLAPEWSSQIALSYSKQRYEDFSAVIGFPSQSVNFAGNDVPRAPKTLASLSLRYEPLALFGSHFELVLDHLGEYYTDQANSQSYGGHVVSQFLATVPINRQFEVYGRLSNITDRVYSTYTSNQVGDPDLTYRPGNPRSLFIGFKYQL